LAYLSGDVEVGLIVSPAIVGTCSTGWIEFDASGTFQPGGC